MPAPTPSRNGHDERRRCPHVEAIHPIELCALDAKSAWCSAPTRLSCHCVCPVAGLPARVPHPAGILVLTTRKPIIPSLSRSPLTHPAPGVTFTSASSDDHACSHTGNRLSRIRPNTSSYTTRRATSSPWAENTIHRPLPLPELREGSRLSPQTCAGRGARGDLAPRARSSPSRIRSSPNAYSLP